MNLVREFRYNTNNFKIINDVINYKNMDKFKDFLCDSCIINFQKVVCCSCKKVNIDVIEENGIKKLIKIDCFDCSNCGFNSKVCKNCLKFEHTDYRNPYYNNTKLKIKYYSCKETKLKSKYCNCCSKKICYHKYYLNCERCKLHTCEDCTIEYDCNKCYRVHRVCKSCKTKNLCHFCGEEDCILNNVYCECDKMIYVCRKCRKHCCNKIYCKECIVNHKTYNCNICNNKTCRRLIKYNELNICENCVITDKNRKCYFCDQKKCQKLVTAKIINGRKRKVLKCSGCNIAKIKNDYSKSQWNRGCKKVKPICFCFDCQNNKIDIKKRRKYNMLKINQKNNTTSNHNLIIKCRKRIEISETAKSLFESYKGYELMNFYLCYKHYKNFDLRQYKKSGGNFNKLNGKVCHLCCKYSLNYKKRLFDTFDYNKECETKNIFNYCRFCDNYFCFDHKFIKSDNIKMCFTCLLKKNRIVNWYREILYHPDSNFVKKIGEEWTKKTKM